MIKNFKEYIKENLPYDGYPGPNLVAKPGDYLKYLYDEEEVNDEIFKKGYGFSFPYDDNGPFITRWSGDGDGQIGIKGGSQSGKIGSEFDNIFVPGGEIDRNIENDELKGVEVNYNKNPRKERILSYLKSLNKK